MVAKTTWRGCLPDAQAHEHHAHGEPSEDADGNNRFEGHRDSKKFEYACWSNRGRAHSCMGSRFMSPKAKQAPCPRGSNINLKKVKADFGLSAASYVLIRQDEISCLDGKERSHFKEFESECATGAHET